MFFICGADHAVRAPVVKAQKGRGVNAAKGVATGHYFRIAEQSERTMLRFVTLN